MRTFQEIPNSDQFYSPFNQSLIKAQEEDGKWIVYLEASNEVKDQEEEVLLCKALKEASDYYLTHGVLSWDHLHKMTGNPKYIIGEPTDVAFNNTSSTLVKGFLYKENEIAQALWKNIMSGAKRIGASVGGAILRKAADAERGLRNVISKVLWNETALTDKPVNDATLGRVSIIPFPEFAKALMAGSGVNAAEFTGGRALTMENLQGAAKKDEKLTDEDYLKLFSEFHKAVKAQKITSYNEMIQFVMGKGYSNKVAADVIQFLSSKMI